MSKRKYVIKNKTVSSRSAVLFFIFVIIFLLIVVKLAYLQLYANNKYSIEEYKDSISYRKLEAKRGSIYDRDGNNLAKSVDRFVAYFSTYDYNRYKRLNEESKAKEDKKLEMIFTLLKVARNEIFEKAEGYNKLIIKEKLTADLIDKIREINSPMIVVEENNAYFLVLEYDRFRSLEEKEKKVEESKIDKICSFLDVDKQKLFTRAESGTHFVIKESIEPDNANNIEELKSSIISIEVEQSRNYVDGKFAPYVIGHSNSHGGQSGIENYFNDYLMGKDGLNRVVRENFSNKISTEILPENGKDLYLTIDSTIQDFVSKYSKDYFEKENPIKLTVIVSDPNNGDILAMENYPKYDLNTPDSFDGFLSKDKQNDLEEDKILENKFKMWRNAAISDLYEPGSVFKLITAASALDENTDTLNSQYFCNGFVKDIPEITIRCFNWQNPHGKQTFTEAMDNSCNPAFVQMARKLGRDNMYKYVYGFGFGEQTGIELSGEAVGQVPKKESDIRAAELATMSFGHGVSTTSLQMMNAANAIVNGGYVLKPHITMKNVEKNEFGEVKIHENKPVVKRQVISKDTSDKMREIMEHGVDEGIAKRVAINGIRIGAKTGTSIKAIQGAYGDDYKVFASIYVAFPIEKPKYSVMVVFDEPKGAKVTGSSVAAPLAKRIIEDIIKYKQIPSSENYKEKVIDKVEVPNLVGLTAEYATELLADRFLDVEFIGTGNDKSVVTKQSQSYKSYISEGSVVKLELSSDPSEKLRVLDFTGMNYDKVIAISGKMGYNIRTVGSKGVLKSQNREANIFIEPADELVLTFGEE